MCAMGPPGGGRNTVTPRFLRHFVIISMNQFSEETLTKIFSTIMSTYLRVSLMTKLIHTYFTRLGTSDSAVAYFEINYVAV